LEPEECEQVVAEVIGGTGIAQIPVEAPMQRLFNAGILRQDADLTSAIREKALRTLPGVHPCDGFFATVLEAAR
jgi:16S rRNA (cytosine967-C5)-methyltransferase